ncbi:MAG: homoserine kinase [Candidatus Baltobacteraceae bacterium]
MSARNFHASAPASSANLGPGFDAIAIALSARMHARVAAARRFALHFTPGPHAPTHDGLRDAIERAMRRLGALPGVRVEIANDIPLGAGLGSSAAAIVLALGIAQRAAGIRLDRTKIAALACEIEGHPDNALAALYGGTTIACDARTVIRLPALRETIALLTIPQIDLSTAAARALLPARYARADVVFSIQRAALLAGALAGGKLDVLREAMRDRIHQPSRAPKIPGLRALLSYDAPGIRGIALSGAGPTAIALLDRGADVRRIGDDLRSFFTDAGIAAVTLCLRPSARGLIVRDGTHTT